MGRRSRRSLRVRVNAAEKATRHANPRRTPQPTGEVAVPGLDAPGPAPTAPASRVVAPPKTPIEVARDSNHVLEEHPIQVVLNGQSLEVPAGTNVQSLLDAHRHPSELPPLGAVVNGRLRSIDHNLVSNCTVRTVDFSSKDGAGIYIRTLILVLCEAVHEVKPACSPVVGQSLAGGYSFTFRVNGELTEEMSPALVRDIKRHMQKIISEDRPVRVRRVAVEEAIEYYRGIKAWDKVKLLETVRRAEVQLASIGKYRDLVVGPLVRTTGILKLFDLVSYASGMILRFPARDFRMRPKPKFQKKLYNAYRETRRWNEELGVANVGQLNEAVIKGHVSDIIRVAEGFHEKKIAAIADEIHDRKNCRLVLVAGPSSSGKTTFTKRLMVQLRVLGLRPVAISMDNYYVDRVDTPKHPDGSYNFESLEALDLELFNAQVKDLIRGKRVETPIYSFTKGERVERTVPMQLGPKDVLISEGIHCLNPVLTEGIPAKRKFTIYVSALTQLSLDDHSRIFTADVRLLRRIVRDRLYRNYTAQDTLRGWGSVRSGENRYIFPFQENADAMFNSALVYEPAVIRTYAERFLLEVPLDSPVMSDCYRLLRFLHMLVPLFPEEVPQNSLLREFIGGSAFRY